jgi:hypothetical protein
MFMAAYGTGILASLASALLENNWNDVTLVGFLGLSTFVFVAFCMMKGKQHLEVFVPLPPNTTEEKALVLLNRDDAKIYAYLKRHSKLKKRRGGMLLRYRGTFVYDSTQKQFTINQGTYTPQVIKVLSHKLRFFYSTI